MGSIFSAALLAAGAANAAGMAESAVAVQAVRVSMVIRTVSRTKYFFILNVFLIKLFPLNQMERT